MNDTTSPWRKAQASNSQGACVEVSADGRTLVRDSKDPDGPVLAFLPAGWQAFTATLRERA